ncbi:MAG: DUF493 domain-containing protein [Pseudomonadales bacterium]|nr:DUF493 domain-containing protein [Pseudomonadales bacterium]
MTATEAPKIQFPCAYPVKVMGLAEPGFAAEVIAIFQRHAPECNDSKVSSRLSAKGNYMALTITIEASGQEQLQKLFSDLKTMPSVKMVL